ncbi:MAG: hypothetical protein Q7S87_01740 [Agitococcus sp.]|nr:hypothetical protein [Agitococcus sp.]
MTVNFGIICEGPTDFVTLKHILNGYFAEQSPKIRCLQPSLDASDKTLKGHHGNWTHVLHYVESDFFHEAFNYLDYIIIQIDTDVCQEPFFNVSTRNKNGEDLSETELYDCVSINIIDRITNSKKGNDIFENYSNKIIFCICIHSLECWLLAHYDPKNRTQSCENHLARYISQKLPTIKYSKESSVYAQLSKPFLKIANITSAVEHSKSFSIFINSLTSVI